MEDTVGEDGYRIYERNYRGAPEFSLTTLGQGFLVLDTWTFEEYFEAVHYLMAGLLLRRLLALWQKDTPVLIYRLHDPYQPVSFHHTSSTNLLSLFTWKAQFMLNQTSKPQSAGTS